MLYFKWADTGDAVTEYGNGWETAESLPAALYMLRWVFRSARHTINAVDTNGRILARRCADNGMVQVWDDGRWADFDMGDVDLVALHNLQRACAPITRDFCANALPPRQIELMEGKGYIAWSDVRRRYMMTDAGQQALRQWLGIGL